MNPTMKSFKEDIDPLKKKTHTFFKTPKGDVTLGSLFIFLGFAFGGNLAALFSPQSRGITYINDALVHAFTYTPVLLGMAIMLIGTSKIIIDYHHQKK